MWTMREIIKGYMRSDQIEKRNNEIYEGDAEQYA